MKLPSTIRVAYTNNHVSRTAYFSLHNTARLDTSIVETNQRKLYMQLYEFIHDTDKILFEKINDVRFVIRYRL